MTPRVCFVVDSGTDVRLAESLAERTTLRILARRLPAGREISQAARQPLLVEVGPAGHFAFGMFVIRRLLALRAEIDIVVVQGYGPTAACANLAGRLTGRAVLMLVCSPVEAYYRCRKSATTGRPFRPIEYWVIRLFSAVNARLGHGYVVLSPYLASVVRAHGARKPVDVIPVYGVDGRIFRPASEPKAAIRARLGLPAAVPIVFFSSRVAPEKDAETVLRAVRILADRGRPVHLLHLSGGHRELMELASRLGVEQHVIAGDAVVPFAPLADYYRASDVCVQSSREEGLGFSPLEALACGIPVIATAVGGLKDTIRDLETGWQVPVGDAEALARSVVTVLDDPAEAARRTSAGAELVSRSYERRVVFDAFVERLSLAAKRQQAIACS
ncbi:MAG: glycosyltransferase [Acidobacteria bacterium]|nr:glycosyltransferase [Acidobacteriota bacterium]